MKKIPDQIIRLIVPFAIIIGGLIFAKWLLTPASFGKDGHYRADAVDEIESLPAHYAGQQVCAECHVEIFNKKAKSYHKGVSCEVCHGPALDHAEDPSEHLPSIERERSFCTLCHNYNPARPTGFPQIVPLTHNPGKLCISCHDSHDPTPSHTPEECSACHGDIARTKNVSPHAKVPCLRCHETSQKHKIDPRLDLPTKPMNREFCGGCHAIEAASPKEVPRVDMKAHGDRYVCWECHYPHLPKAYKEEVR